jgi:hypothetical protein
MSNEELPIPKLAEVEKLFLILLDICVISHKNVGQVCNGNHAESSKNNEAYL